MKKCLVISILIISAIIFTAFTGKSSKSLAKIALSDSLEKDRAKYTAIVMAEINGKENLPADSVFKI